MTSRCLLTETEKEFIRANSARMTAREIGSVLGRTRDTVRSYIYRERLPTPRRRVNLTTETIEIIRREYPTTDTEILAAKLGLTRAQVYTAALKRGIYKTVEFKREQLLKLADNLQRSGKSHRFQPGQSSWNAGKKIGLRGRSGETTFKKGNRPASTANVGDIAPIKGGYLKIKVAEPNRWRLLHRLRWEEAYGPIPKGFAIEFIDRDVTNCDLANLRLISRVDLMKRNTIHNLPEDLKTTIQALGTLKRRITNHGKKQARRSEESSL